jgi:hypothetical protein
LDWKLQLPLSSLFVVSPDADWGSFTEKPPRCCCRGCSCFFFFFFWCLSVHCGRGFVHNLSFPLPLHFFLVCCYARLLGCYHVVFSSYTVVVMWTVCHRLGTPLFFGPLSLSLLPSPPPLFPPFPAVRVPSIFFYAARTSLRHSSYTALARSGLLRKQFWTTRSR